MKKLYAIGFAAVAALPLAGCYTPEERAVGGALLGGATGAVIGSAATGGRASGLAAGAAIGAASGAIIGASTAPVYADPYYPAPPPRRRVYASPVYPAPARCWFERQPVLDSWGRVVAYQRVRVCG